MSTNDYIPPENPLKFHPAPPPLDSAVDGREWVLEIGPGKGEFILDQAQNHPKKIFVAVEYKHKRFKKISARIDRLELTNLFLIYGDARECLPRMFPRNFFSSIYILFPDPWPKKRHAKHRLIKPRLAEQLKEFLQPGGAIINATDAGFYSEEIVAAFDEVGGYQKQAIASPYPTYFEQKWIQDGRKINYWKFIKAAS